MTVGDTRSRTVAAKEFSHRGEPWLRSEGNSRRVRFSDEWKRYSPIRTLIDLVEPSASGLPNRPSKCMAFGSVWLGRPTTPFAPRCGKPLTIGGNGDPGGCVHRRGLITPFDSGLSPITVKLSFAESRSWITPKFLP